MEELQSGLLPVSMQEESVGCAWATRPQTYKAFLPDAFALAHLAFSAFESARLPAGDIFFFGLWAVVALPSIAHRRLAPARMLAMAWALNLRFLPTGVEILVEGSAP